MVWRERRSSDRHIVELPVKYRVLEEHKGSKKTSILTVTSKSKNICDGGLLFLSSETFKVGTFLELSFPVKDRIFNMQGRVVHVSEDPETGLYKIGIFFSNADYLFKVKMAEQLRQIHQYQQQLSKDEGRIVSEGEAAQKWIEKHSDTFAEFFKTGS